MIMRMALFIGLIVFISSCSNTTAKKRYEVASSSVAVVELFTSEGCSSCPPADKLLNELVENVVDNDLPIYVLGFHVDYWNYIGWEDRFSDPIYATKQKSYAQILNSSVYTPQMIVNGSQQFLGSSRPKMESALESALKVPAKTNITVLGKKTGAQGQLIFDYQVKNVPENSYLSIGIVESSLSSDIQAGENNGKSITHANVVRAYRAINLKKGNGEGEIGIALPKELNQANSKAILYVQNRGDLEITGAIQIDL